MTARLSDFNNYYSEICRTEKKKPRLREGKRKKTSWRHRCKCVERLRTMVSIGIVEIGFPIPVYRDGYRVEVYVNDSSSSIVIRVFPVIWRQVHVLVWRHKKRHQQSETHRKHSDTTH